MVEIVISVAAKIAEYFVAPVARPFSYLWNYETNLESLKNEVKKLEAEREDVQHSVEDARNNCEEIKKHVESWLEDVKKIIDEASAVGEDNHQQASMQCFNGFSCTKLMKRYQHSKKAAKLKAVVEVQEEAGKFEKVSYHTIPEQACLQPSKGYQTFESRMSILKDVIDALSDSDVNMVGIYGMGGVGKTTLAKEVARKVGPKNGLSLFDKIIFVEVSELPDIKNIRGVVAENLGLQFIDETDSGRANRLCERLKKEEKILLILDNIWGRIDFEELGIPKENDHRGLKLLLTTRNRNVLSNQMDCQCTFEVNALNKVDAWSLFTSITGTFIEQPDLNSIAREVSDECGGIPVAIVAIAEALKGQGQNEWRNALRELKNPSSKSFGGIAKGVYTSIKLSYTYLENEELKETFLLCSRMGCTYDASVQDLFRYGLGLGLFENFNTLEEALCNVYVSVNKLKAASLLLDAPKSETIFDPPTSERFAMHDIICDVAKSIANVFTVIDVAIPQSWTNENTLKNCTSITLHNIDELPEDLELVCPQLKLLYVKPKKSSFRIPDNFFTRMLGLQVLHLIGINLQPLPTSISDLVGLQMLCLDRCELRDMAVIGNLKKLKILSFCGSNIEKLPKEMHHLTELRLIDLTNCSKLSVIPPNVMSNLKKLEALYMGNTSIQWEVERPNIERSNVSIDELKHLHYLTMLEIHIPNAKMSKGLLSQKLEKYKIFIGDKCGAWRWSFGFKTSRMLKLSLNTNEDENILQYLKGIEELELGEVPGATNLVDALDRNGFPKLKHLHVDSNSHCSCIVESCDALPLLESLDVGHMKVLEKICNRPLGANSFLRLRTIRVDKCHNLNNIFSSSAVTILPQLQEIDVSTCENMEEIFAIGGQDDANNTEVVHEIEFSQLRILRLQQLSRLKSFCCKVKTDSPLQLTSDTQPGEIISEEEMDICTLLFNEKVAFPNLQTLHISEIHVEKIWHNLPSKISSCVQNLTQLRIYCCGNLKELFSSPTVVTDESREEEMRDTIWFPKLNYLEIKTLEKLTTLWSGYHIKFPTLKDFSIHGFPQLDAFIFDDKVAFPNLQTLYISKIHVEKIWHNLPPKISSCVQNLINLRISDCGNLKELFSSPTVVTDESREEEMRDTILFPELHRLRIENLEKLTTLWSGYHIEFPTLKDFIIQGCPQLDEFIFDDKVAFPNLQTLDISKIPVEKIWHNLPPKISSCVQNLINLRISDCGNLKELFSSPTVVTDESREEEMRDTILFPELHHLRIENLEKLTTLWSGYHIKFPTLKDFIIRGCPQLDEFIFDDKVRVPSLEKMMIWDMDNLKMIWHNQLDGDSFSKLKSLEVNSCGNLKELFSSSTVVMDESREEEMRDTILFPKLNRLEIENLEKLTTSWSGYHIEFPTLKEFIIESCPQLDEFIFDDKVRVPSLEKMMIWNMDNLKMIWHNQLDGDSFSKLKSLKVYDCQKLVKVFPSNICGGLLSLESLTVERCGSLEEIFDLQGIISEERNSIATRELCFSNLQELEVRECQSLKYLFAASNNVANDEYSPKFLFPKLTSLILLTLPELRSFYPGRYTVEGPVLKMLKLRDCFIHDTDKEDQMQMQKPLCLLEQAFPCLEELRLGGKCVMMMRQGQVPESLFHKLKILEVEDGDSTGLPLCIIQRFQNLEKLSIETSSYQEIFLNGEDQTLAATPTKIKTLNLHRLEDLNCMWKQDFKLDLIFQNLEVLNIWGCNSLINVIPPSASFQNLTVMKVRSCRSLINIGTSSAAKSLVQLTEMKILDCGNIIEVVGNHGDVTEDEIIFPKLKSLTLRDLPSLTSFCSWNVTLQFPSLEELNVYKCRQMKIFSRGVLTMQTSWKVKIDYESIELHPDVDINKAIQQFHEKVNDSENYSY